MLTPNFNAAEAARGAFGGTGMAFRIVASKESAPGAAHGVAGYFLGAVSGPFVAALAGSGLSGPVAFRGTADVMRRETESEVVNGMTGGRPKSSGKPGESIQVD